MIQAEAAIRAARGLIGTAYSELDCINLIKKVIRTCAGGDKRYTTAGTNELWNSFDSAPKYRHLIWRQAGISGAKPGMLAFMGVGTGDVSHIGLVTEQGTVIHSSKSRGGVVETALTEKNGWNGLGVHRMIGVEGSGDIPGLAAVCPADPARVSPIYRAQPAVLFLQHGKPRSVRDHLPMYRPFGFTRIRSPPPAQTMTIAHIRRFPPVRRPRFCLRFLPHRSSDAPPARSNRSFPSARFGKR